MQSSWNPYKDLERKRALIPSCFGAILPVLCVPKALPTPVNATQAADLQRPLITNQMTVNVASASASLSSLRPLEHALCVSHEIIAAIFTHIPNTFPAAKGKGVKKEGRKVLEMAIALKASTSLPK